MVKIMNIIYVYFTTMEKIVAGCYKDGGRYPSSPGSHTVHKCRWSTGLSGHGDACTHVHSQGYTETGVRAQVTGAQVWDRCPGVRVRPCARLRRRAVLRKHRTQPGARGDTCVLPRRCGRTFLTSRRRPRSRAGARAASRAGRLARHTRARAPPCPRTPRRAPWPPGATLVGNSFHGSLRARRRLGLASLPLEKSSRWHRPTRASSRGGRPPEPGPASGMRGSGREARKTRSPRDLNVCAWHPGAAWAGPAVGT